jgi:hypothetical protein
MTYWVARNTCAVEDRTILGIWDRCAARLDALRADPDLSRLHRDGVAWRRRRIEELLSQEAPLMLFKAMLLSPPPRPIAPDEARTLIRYVRARMKRQLAGR